jgi:AcrR family transcriptional regulator
MSRAEQKQLTRQRILDAAGRGFRECGYGGVGVDALAQAAGVTSGAFYVHFDSKAAAFRDAVVQGVADVDRAVRKLQVDDPRGWWPAFVAFYLGTRRKSALAESCGLQSLTSEVARADVASRGVFETELRAVGQTIAAGPPSPGAPRTVDSACAALATLIGAVTLARAVRDPALADQIAAAAERALLPSVRPRKAAERKARTSARGVRTG